MKRISHTKKKLCEQYPSNLIWSVLSLGGTEAWEKWGHPILCWSDISLYYLYRAGNSHFFFFPFSLFHSSYVRFSKLHPFHFCLLCTRMQAQAHLLAYRKEPGIGMSWKETRETYWLTWAIICLNRFSPLMKSYENLYVLLVDLPTYLFIFVRSIQWYHDCVPQFKKPVQLVWQSAWVLTHLRYNWVLDLSVNDLTLLFFL
jgi:hypothetical protein